MDDLIKALTIFLKYGNPRSPTNCSHDVLFVAIAPRLVSEEDRVALDALGFFIEGEPDEGEEPEQFWLEDALGFMSYRFGSC